MQDIAYSLLMAIIIIILFCIVLLLALLAFDFTVCIISSSVDFLHSATYDLKESMQRRKIEHHARKKIEGSDKL